MDEGENNKITLKEFIMSKFADNDSAVKSALASLDKRLDSMNEFRQQLKDQGMLYYTKTEAQGFHDKIDETVIGYHSKPKG